MCGQVKSSAHPPLAVLRAPALVADLAREAPVYVGSSKHIDSRPTQRAHPGRENHILGQICLKREQKNKEQKGRTARVG